MAETPVSDPPKGLHRSLHPDLRHRAPAGTLSGPLTGPLSATTLRLDPVRRAGPRLRTAFHRLRTTGAGPHRAHGERLVHAALDALDWAPQMRVSVALPAGVLSDAELRDRLAARLAQAGHRAERLILELPEAALATGDPDAAAALARHGPALALALSGTLPAHAERLRAAGLDFVLAAPALVAAADTADGAFVFGLMRQLADRHDLGLVATGIAEAEQRALAEDLGADFLTGPALARGVAPAAVSQSVD